MNEQFFKAPWGVSVKLVSLLTSAILLGIPLYAIAAGQTAGFGAIMILTPLSILLGALPFTIRGYELQHGELWIHRLGWKTVIPLDDLESCEYRPSALARTLRLFGNGGLYSVTGLFRNKEFGNFRAYVMHPKLLVVMKFSSRTIVISPETPEDFVEAVKALKPVKVPDAV